MPITKTKASVTFEADVRDYLKSLGDEIDRDRSWIVNRIVRLYRRRVEEGSEQIELFDRSIELVSPAAEVAT